MPPERNAGDLWIGSVNAPHLVALVRADATFRNGHPVERVNVAAWPMTVHDTYGTSTHTVVELAELVADLLGLSFVERDSCYRGVYFLAEAAPYRIEVLVRVGVI